MDTRRRNCPILPAAKTRGRIKSRAIRLNDRNISDFSSRYRIDCQAVFVINREREEGDKTIFQLGPRMRWKKSKANLKLRPVSNPSPRAGSEEKNRNEGSGLTNYIVNKINRENKNVRTMKVGAYYALLFLHGGRNTCCLFYSVEFDSLQQITASRSKKENHVSASRNFPSLFFLLSLSFLFLFFFYFFFWIDHPYNFLYPDNWSNCTLKFDRIVN